MADIIAVQDLSGIGRCSMNAAISILSAMGHHCVPLPTAVLSNQTGFGTYSYLDLTNQIPLFLKHWKTHQLAPDAIYAGFLGSNAQPSILTNELIPAYPHAFVLIDPVMGDNGMFYSCFDKAYLKEMKHLIAKAHLITPNPTELFLLTGLPADTDWSNLSDQDFLQIASSINAEKLTDVIVTGCSGKTQAENVCIDIKNRKVERIAYTDTGICYSGTGDVFASIVCGGLMSGKTLSEAVRLAAEFISYSISGLHSDPRYGIPYESNLRRLTPDEAN